VAAGHPGNICVTVLFKTTVYPIVRFDTQDVTTLLTQPGEPGPGRIAGFQGRSDNMVKLRGVNVYPTAVGAHLAEHPATLGEYICRVTRQGHRDIMTVVIEVASDAVGDTKTTADLSALLRRKLGVDVDVETAAAGDTASLTQIEARQKPIRLIDDRCER
jgi:phenylacetate-CoA ligase